MPLIWRYLLTHYFKVLSLCVVAFIAILLTTRLEDIAHFAALGPSAWLILRFTIYQIPYILPIALPISCLISAMLLIQRLSVTHELTAFRSCGLSLRSIFAPILLASTLLSMATFYVVSEMATSSHLATGLLKKELRSVNPLLLLHNKHLMKLKGFYFQTMGTSKMGDWANDVIIAIPDTNRGRMHVMVAKHLQSTDEAFIGDNVTLISNLESKVPGQFDHLMLENAGHSSTMNLDFAQVFQKTIWNLNEDHLRLPQLLLKLNDDLTAKADAIQNSLPASEQKQMQRCINRCYSELARRVSLALAAFTFTLMGAAFGVNISRRQTNFGVITVIVLSALYLAAFFAAKALDHHLIASMALYFTPHLLMVTLSLWTLSRSIKGIE